MIIQTFRLDDYNWNVKIFYDAFYEDLECIAQCLHRVGCDPENINDVKYLLQEYNSGFTYSSLEDHISVIIIGRANNSKQFNSTADHEKGHLAMHIAQALDLDPLDEEIQYLLGTIGELMFPVLRTFICEHCKKEIALI